LLKLCWYQVELNSGKSRSSQIHIKLGWTYLSSWWDRLNLGQDEFDHTNVD